MLTECDLNKIFSNSEEWHKEVEALKKHIETFSLYVAMMTESISDFKKAIMQKILVDTSIEKVYCYPKRYLDIDNTQEDKLEMFRCAGDLYGQILEIEEVFRKKILTNPELTADFEDKYPYYKRYLEVIKTSCTATQNGYLDGIKEIYRALTERDLRFGEVTLENGEKKELTNSLFRELMENQNDEVRKNALITRNRAYDEIKNTLAAILNQRYLIEVRLLNGYPSVLDRSLGELNISKKVFLNLLKTAKSNSSVLREFIDLRKSILNRSEYHTYDTMLPFEVSSKIEIDFADAVEIIKKSLEILGEDYLSKLDKAFKEGWVDVYPKKTKRKMSYSCITYSGVPYAFLNYDKSLISVRTLAHELGHSIHTDYSKEANAFEYFEYSLFLSEIVSKVNEILINEYMLEKISDSNEKIYLLNNIISSLINTLFGQIILTEFEHGLFTDVENNRGLTAESLNEKYRNIYEDFYKDSIILDVDNSCEWARIPHFIMNPPYYLYQYAIGVSIAIHIVKKLKQDPSFASKYIDFLKIGNTKNVEESLKTIGIDINDKIYFEESYEYLRKYIRMLQKAANKTDKKIELD